MILERSHKSTSFSYGALQGSPSPCLSAPTTHTAQLWVLWELGLRCLESKQVQPPDGNNTPHCFLVLSALRLPPPLCCLVLSPCTLLILSQGCPVGLMLILAVE